jgi:hypothetical protein
MKRSRFFSGAVCAVVVLCATGPALAQATATASPTPETLTLARRYIVAVGLEGTMVAAMDTVIPIMVESMEKRIGTLPPGAQAVLQETAVEAARAVMPMLVDRMTPVVASTFTQPELEAAVSYYESPMGKAVVTKTKAFSEAMLPIQRQMAPAFQEEFQKRLCVKIGCDTDAERPPSAPRVDPRA